MNLLKLFNRLPWQLLILAALFVWVVVAIVTDHARSGALMGRAIGSLGDPIFVIITLLIAIPVRRCWLFLIAALVLALAYSYYAWTTRTLYFPDYPFPWDAAIGRFLAIMAAGAVVSLAARVVWKERAVMRSP